MTTFYFGGISSTGEGTFIRKKEREIVLRSEFGLYYDDYKLLQTQTQKLNTNRFKLLAEIEKSNTGRKVMSFFLRFSVMLFSKKKLKDILN